MEQDFHQLCPRLLHIEMTSRKNASGERSGGYVPPPVPQNGGPNDHRVRVTVFVVNLCFTGRILYWTHGSGNFRPQMWGVAIVLDHRLAETEKTTTKELA
jgi:hypothetical protein